MTLYTTEYYSAIKQNQMRPFAATRMDPEIVILGEVKPDAEIRVSYGIAYRWNLKKKRYR